MTFALYVVLHSSGMPNNVYEPFRERGGVSGLMLFSTAAIVPGFGSRAIGWRPGKVSRPWLEVPFLVSALGVLRLGLLILSVTEERVAHITDSNNRYLLVTDRDVWGARGRDLFRALDGPEPFRFFERLVRFLALFGPLVIVLTWLFTLPDRFTQQRRLGVGWRAPITLEAPAFIWLCQFTAFDHSSTDNLNELIARDGFFGTAGSA